MDELFTKVVLVLLLAAGGEGIIEFLASPILDWILADRESKARVVIFNWLSAGLGIGLAFGFKVGIASLFGGVPTVEWLDYAFSGALMGRGFNWLHAFFKKFALSIQEKLSEIKLNEETLKSKLEV